MTEDEFSATWFDLWDRADKIVTKSRDPQFSLDFCEGGALRKEMEQQFFGLARLALTLPDEQCRELLGMIGSVYQLEIARLPTSRGVVH